MENDGKAAGPEIPVIKVSERVSRMHDEDGIQGKVINYITPNAYLFISTIKTY